MLGLYAISVFLATLSLVAASPHVTVLGRQEECTMTNSLGQTPSCVIVEATTMVPGAPDVGSSGAASVTDLGSSFGATVTVTNDITTYIHGSTRATGSVLAGLPSSSASSESVLFPNSTVAVPIVTALVSNITWSPSSTIIQVSSACSSTPSSSTSSTSSSFVTSSSSLSPWVWSSSLSSASSSAISIGTNSTSISSRSSEPVASTFTPSASHETSKTSKSHTSYLATTSTPTWTTSITSRSSHSWLSFANSTAKPSTGGSCLSMGHGPESVPGLSITLPHVPCSETGLVSHSTGISPVSTPMNLSTRSTSIPSISTPLNSVTSITSSSASTTSSAVAPFGVITQISDGQVQGVNAPMTSLPLGIVTIISDGQPQVSAGPMA